MTFDVSKANRQTVEMSPQAITERLRMTEALRRLCLSLAQAKPAAGNPTTEAEAPADVSGS